MRDVADAAQAHDLRQDWRLGDSVRQQLVDRLVHYATATDDAGKPVYGPRVVCRAVQTLATLLRLQVQQQRVDSNLPPRPDEFDARAALEEAEAIVARSKPGHPDRPQQ